MTGSEIQSLIKDNHQKLYLYLESHSDQLWNKGPTGKWTTGQHIIHLTQTLEAINGALRYPTFLLSWKFGKPNRATRNYDYIVNNYRTKLEQVGPVTASISRNMPPTPIEGKNQLIQKLKEAENVLAKNINRRSEKNLDSILIPHPLMGRMILRELLIWSGYHVEHHLETLETKY